MPGAHELLTHLVSHGVPIALATSSHRHNFLLKTKHLYKDGFDMFADAVVVVGDDERVPRGRGKPCPDIWLVALEALNAEKRAEYEDAVAAAKKGEEKEEGDTKKNIEKFIDIKPEECLIFEDGVPGVQAGRAAGATVIWVPDARALEVLDGREIDIIGDQGEILESLHMFDKAKYGLDKKH